MADIVLLVFEGEKTEPQILENLKRHYFNDEQKSIIHVTYNTDIYALWNKVKEDEYLDLIEIIRTKNARNQAELTDIDRDRVSQIFLFFDYDGHATQASDESIEEMLRHFDNETENGKLYISYPMVEALKHLPSDMDFKEVVVSAKEIIKCAATNAKYKELVGRSTIHQNFKKLTKDDWKHIILSNYKKANWLVTDFYEIPHYNAIHILNQNNIFNCQLEKFIAAQGKVAVLSAFPFFIIEYFGENEFNTLTA